jgi:CheY-like chemotaxis protein
MVVDYLNECKADPFMIISDINMPFMNGYELREKIHKDPKLTAKTTPYILMSTDSSTHNFFDNAANSIQGYFAKPVNIEDYKILITNMLSYWKKNLLPTS